MLQLPSNLEWIPLYAHMRHVILAAIMMGIHLSAQS